MIVFVIFSAFIISFIVLCLSRKYLAGTKIFNGDTFFHLLIGKSIRNHNWKYPTSFQNVTFDEAEEKYHYLRYPPLFHYLIAIFPIRYHLELAQFLNLILLCFLGTLTSFFSYTLTSNVYVAVLSSLITVFSMAIFELEVMFTPRPLGLLFYSLVVCISIFYPRSLLSILAIPLLVASIILTHKFATQLLVFSLIPYVIIFGEFYLLVEFLIGILLALIISKGGSLRILREHISWLYFYSRFPSKAPLLKKLKTVIVRNFWYIAVITGIAILFYSNSTVFQTQLISNIIFWAFIPLTVAFTVSIPYLAFLGEDYRYIEYSVVPLGIISSILIMYSNFYVLLAFSLSLFLSFLALYKYKRHLCSKKYLVESDDILSYKLLNNYNLENMLVFPHTRSLEVNYFTALKVIHPVRPKESMTLSQNIANLLGKYKITHILKFKGLDSNEEFDTLKQMVNLKLILDLPNYELYELSK